MVYINIGLMILVGISIAALIRVLLRQQTLNHRITTQLLGAAMTTDTASRAWVANKILSPERKPPPDAPRQQAAATGVAYEEID